MKIQTGLIFLEHEYFTIDFYNCRLCQNETTIWYIYSGERPHTRVHTSINICELPEK